MRIPVAAAAFALLVLIPPAASADALEEARAAFLAAWEAAPLSVGKALLVTGPAAGYGLYEERGANAFAPDEPIHIYLEPVGYGWLPEGGQNRFGTEVGLTVRGQEGQVLFAQDGFLNLTTLSAAKPTEFFGNVTLNLTGLEPGAYVLELELGDIASDETAVASLPIEIAGASASAQ